MLKIEINSYDTSALRHLGAALTAMAADRKAEDAQDPYLKDKCACTETQAVPAPPAPPVSNAFVVEGSEQFTVPPVTMGVPASAFGVILAELVVPPAPPAPPAEDDDAAWPDPPGAAPADNLDADGIPWDARIHAGTKTRLKADNTWKLKPGIDKALVDQVKAELKGIQAVPVPPAPPAPTLADAVVVSAILQAPPAPTPPGPTNFAELIKEVTGRISAGQMTPDRVNGAVALVTNGQLTMCNQLAARQDLIPAVWSVLCPA